MDLTSAQWRKSSYSDANGGHCIEVAGWRKSSYTGSNGGDCVELAGWRKASASDGNGGDCVEVASQQSMVAVRDSKDPDGAVLSFGVGAFSSFVAEIKRS